MKREPMTKVLQPEAQTIDRAEIRRLADYYRQHLIDDVMHFWDPRVADPKHPGLFHQFDRTGARTGDDKYIWCQGGTARVGRNE